MPKIQVQELETGMKILALEVKKSNELLDRHITSCEKTHELLDTRVKQLETSYTYFNIYEKLKTIGLVMASGVIGWLLKTVISYK